MIETQETLFLSSIVKLDEGGKLRFSVLLSCARHAGRRFIMGMSYKRGNVWWVKYYRNGKSIRESSKSKSKMVADRLLKRREGEIAQGQIPGVLFDKTTFEQLAEGLLQDYKINEKKYLIE